MKSGKLRILAMGLIISLSFGILVNAENVDFIDDKLELIEEGFEDYQVIEDTEDIKTDNIGTKSTDNNIKIILEKGRNYRIENKSDEDLSKYVKLDYGYMDYRYIDKYGELHYKDADYSRSLKLDGKVEYIVTLTDKKILSIPQELLDKDIFIEETNEEAIYYETLEKGKNYQIENRGKEDLSDYITLSYGYMDYRYIDKYGELHYKDADYSRSLKLDGEVEYIVTLRDEKVLTMPYNKYEDYYNKDIFIVETNEEAIYYETLGKGNNYQIENRGKEDLSDYITLSYGYMDYRYIDKYGELHYKDADYSRSLKLDGEVEYIITLRDEKVLTMPYNKYEDYYNKDIFIEETNEEAIYYEILGKGKSYKIENRGKEDLSDYIRLSYAYMDYRYIDKYGELYYKDADYSRNLKLDGEVEYIVTLTDEKVLTMPYNKYEDYYNKDIFIEESLVPALYKKELTWKKPMIIENISKGNNLVVRFGRRGEFEVRHLDYSGNLIEDYKKTLNDIIVPSNGTLELTHVSKQDNYVYTPFNNVEEYLIVDKEKELTREYKDFPGKDINDEKKSWTIEFNQTIDGFTANKRNVYIVDSKGEKFKNMNVKSVGNKIILENMGRFTKGEKYEVVIERGVRSVNGKSLTNGVSMKFNLN